MYTIAMTSWSSFSQRTGGRSVGASSTGLPDFLITALFTAPAEEAETRPGRTDIRNQKIRALSSFTVARTEFCLCTEVTENIHTQWAVSTYVAIVRGNRTRSNIRTTSAKERAGTMMTALGTTSEATEALLHLRRIQYSCALYVERQ